MLEQLLKDPSTVVVDVRNPAEFTGGHVAGSINIPLNEIMERLDEIRRMPHVVICCASGMRSQMACAALRQQQINCTDGGSWTNVNFLMNQPAPNPHA